MSTLAAVLSLMPSGSLTRLLRRNPIPPAVLRGHLAPKVPSQPPTEAPIHLASGAIGSSRPLMVHCPFCSTGRAKRTDTTYYCSPSRAGCGVRFVATGFEFDARGERPPPGGWILLGMHLDRGQPGVWVYEVT